MYNSLIKSCKHDIENKSESFGVKMVKNVVLCVYKKFKHVTKDYVAQSCKQHNDHTQISLITRAHQRKER